MKANKIKLKHIESFLSDLDDFEYGEKGKWHLEQHKTPANIAAGLLHHINELHDVSNSMVCDLGVGTGTFLAGLLFIGAPYAVGYELDEKYAAIARDSIDQKLENPCFDIIVADITQKPKPRLPLFDIVVTNPPFGTKIAGIDMAFVQFASSICSGTIYSFHKTTTREYIEKAVCKWGLKGKVIQTVDFALPKRYDKYHKKQVEFTQVDIWQFDRVPQ